MGTKQTAQINYFPLSPSRISGMDCGHYFEQKYVLKNRRSEEEENALMFLGTLIGKLSHRVMDLYNSTCKDRKIPSDMDIFTQAFETAWNEQNYLPESQYPEIKIILANFVENNPVDPETLLGTEMRVSLNWDLETTGWTAEDIWLRGILDKVDIYPIDGTAVITDYKYFLPSESKLKSSYQTKIYPFLMKCLNPYLNKIILVYHGIKTNRKVDFEFDIGEIGPIEDALRDLSKRIARKIANPETKWTARAGLNCVYCYYDCPLLALGIEPLKTNEQAVNVGSKLYAMKREVKILEDEMKVYCSATDEHVDIGAGEYLMKEMFVRRGMKADHIAKVALEAGIDLNIVLKPNTDKIKALPDDDIKKALLEGSKESLQRKFTFEKHQEDDEDNEVMA